VYRHGLALVQCPLLLLMRGELPPLRPVRITMDATDLCTLPPQLVPWWRMRRDS